MLFAVVKITPRPQPMCATRCRCRRYGALYKRLHWIWDDFHFDLTPMCHVEYSESPDGFATQYTQLTQKKYGNLHLLKVMLHKAISTTVSPQYL